MSFIAHRESIFYKKKHGVLSRKRSCGRLKNINSCTDSRAWSTDKNSLRNYMLETFTNVTPSSSAENTSIYIKANSSNDNISIYKTVKNSMKMNSKTFKLPKQKVHSAENLYVSKGVEKLESKLIDADGKIEELQRANKQLKKNNSKCSIEVDNMRNLIKELQQQITHLESLKEENSVLRSESNTDVKNQLLKAEDEIYYLQKELEIFQEIKLKHDALKAEHDVLQEEHVSLTTALNSLKDEEQNLKVQFSSQKEELFTWKSRALDMSNMICDKNLLIEKINIKDQNLATLNKHVQNQEICIQQLNLQMSRITAEFEQKQLLVARQLEELQLQLSFKSTKVLDLESKLGLMEHLVVELEILREQFRLSNNELIENVVVYKKQFYNAMTTSNQMVDLVEKLKKELSEKNEELEKIKLFPQSAKTMVYFSQLNNLIKSSTHFIDSKDSSLMTDVFLSIQKIVSNIKNDMWGPNELSLITELSDSFSQTDFSKQDIWTQMCINNTHTEIQTCYPDEFVIKYQEAEKIIEQLTCRNQYLDESHNAQKQITETLQQRFTNTLEDLQSKESLILQLNESNNILHDHLISVNEKLKYSDGLLVKAASQLDFESHLQSSNCQLENALDTAVTEYKTYVNVLEVCLEYKENNLQMLYKLLNREDSEVNETENVTKFQIEVDNLNKELDRERIKSEELGKVAANLLNDISDQSFYVKEIEKKLMNAENLIENLFSNLSTEEFKSITYSNMEQSAEEKEAEHFQVPMILDRYQEVTTQKETNLVAQKTSKGQYKKCLKLNTIEKKEMKMRIIQMNTNMRRVRKIINDLRNRLLVSEKLINELQTISDLLSLENGDLKKSNTNLVEEVGGLKSKLNSCETELKSQELVVNQYSDLKRKMEKVIIALLKKLSKYKILFDKEQMNKETITNEYYMKTVAQRDHLNSEIDLLKTENVTLSGTIFKLQERVSSLFNLPQKESKSIEIQAEMKSCISEEEKELIFKKIKDHYEAILQALQKEHSTEKEQSQKQYRNNLKMLKDTYERDMNAIKKTHVENLTKLQSLHEEEMMIIKETQTEKDKEIEGNHALQSFHQEEIEALKIKFEKLIQKKEELFKDEKEMLIAQMSKSVLEKEVAISKINIEMASKFMKYKSKCKLNLKKIKEKHKLDLDHIILRCKHELKRFIKREEEKRPAREEKEVQYDVEDYSSTPTKANTDDKSTGISKYDKGMFNVNEALYAFANELTDIHMEDKNENRVSNNLSFVANTNFFGSSVDIGEATISLVHETSIYAEQIARLETELRLKQHEFSEKVTAYEKSIRHEKMKAKEVKLQYEQELQHNVKVHHRLGAQYNKTEELEFENQLLLKQISVYESQLKVLQRNLEKERDETSSMKCALNILKAKPKGCYQLELSLNRLKKKIEQAVECEKRLTEELKKENHRALQKFDAEAAIKISKYENHQINSEKVIQIQACGVVQLGMDVN